MDALGLCRLGWPPLASYWIGLVVEAVERELAILVGNLGSRWLQGWMDAPW